MRRRRHCEQLYFGSTGPGEAERRAGGKFESLCLALAESLCGKRGLI